jgi:hypothetical protein
MQLMHLTYLLLTLGSCMLFLLDIEKTRQTQQKRFIICFTKQLVSTQLWGHHQVLTKKLMKWLMPDDDPIVGLKLVAL